MCKDTKKVWIALFLTLAGGQGNKVVVRKEGIQIMPPIVEMKNFDTTKYNLKTIGSFFSYCALSNFLNSVNVPKKIAANFVADEVVPLPENGTAKKWVITNIALQEKDFAAIANANNGSNLVWMNYEEVADIIKKTTEKKEEKNNLVGDQFDITAYFAKKVEPKYRVDDTHIKLFEAFLSYCHPRDGNFNLYEKVLKYNHEIDQEKKQNHRGNERRSG